MLDQEAVDGCLKVDERMEDAAFEAAVGQLSEEILDSIESGARGWRKVGSKARVPVESLADLWVLVSGIAILADPLKTLSVRGREVDDYATAHPH